MSHTDSNNSKLRTSSGRAGNKQIIFNAPASAKQSERPKVAPEYVKPEGLRTASKADGYTPDGKKKSCATCRWFEMSSFSAPCGWCHKFPCQKVNCSVGDVCNKWENMPKGPQGPLFTEREILSRIIDGAAGFQVVLPRMQGKQTLHDILNYKAQVAAMMSSLGCTDKEYILSVLTDEQVKAAIGKKIAPGELALTLIEEKPQE